MGGGYFSSEGGASKLGQKSWDQTYGRAGAAWDKTFGTTKAHSQAKEGEKNAKNYYAQSQPINQKMNEADQAFVAAAKPSLSQYKSGSGYNTINFVDRQDKLAKEAAEQGTNAKLQYTNTIQPKLKGIMEESGREAANAMSLKDAGNVNNSIHKSVRDLYDKQGQQTRQRGLADFGVLSALGAQATAGQLGGGGPMTAGAMGQLGAANQRQASEAVQRAQGRVYDLEQQGLDRGFSESAAQYDRGQGAKDRYTGSLKDMTAAEGDYLGKQQGLRDERGGYNEQRFGAQQAQLDRGLDVDQQYAGLDRDLAYGAGERELGALGAKYGTLNQILGNKMAENQARQAGQTQFAGSALGAAATAYASDMRLKENIEEITDADLDEFFEAVKPKTYDYKAPGAAGQAPGRRVGFMIQDVQGTKLGDAITIKGPDGHLYVDRDNLDGILMAVLKRQRAVA